MDIYITGRLMRDYDILLFCVSCNVIEGPLWLDGYQLK